MALSHRIVVMNKGIVEQIGTPTEIYDRPATEYVASFIGEMNFFHENDGSTIAVRPEDVVITKEEQSGAVQGYVRTIMVLGHYVEVNVDVGDNVVKTYLTRSLADSLKVRDKVSLLFNKKCIYAA